MAGKDQQRVETELQFEAPDLAWVERWLATYQQPGLAIEPRGEVCQEDEYLDSESFVVHRAGYALRLRRIEGKPTVAALKGLAASKDGLARRREIEQDLDEHEPDVGSSGSVGDRVRVLAGDASLRQLFLVKTRRRAFVLRRNDEDVAELVLDDTILPRERFGDIRLQRVEVEELREGWLAESNGFTDALVSACGLSPARTSKFESGLQAHGIVPTATPYLGPTQTSAEDTARAFGLAKLRVQFGEFLRNEPGSRLGEDSDAVHDMRVATRRIRAAISTFHDALPEDFRRLRDELRWFGRVLGEVRDFDVQIETLEDAGLPPFPEAAAGLAALTAKLEAQRRGAHSRLIAALDSQRFRTLVNDMSLALSHDGTAPHERQMPVTQLAPDRIKHRYRKFRDVAKESSPESPPDELHEVRIRAKRLRFTIEAFEELYGREARRTIEAVIDVQDRLGEHQDLHVLSERLRSLTRTYGRELAPEALMLAGALIERYESRAAAIRAAWKDGPRDVFKRWRRLRDDLKDGEPEPTDEPGAEAGEPS